MNKTGNNVAEFMEKRVSTKGNNQQVVHSQTQSWDNVVSRLLVVRNVAKKDKKQQFTNLYHHINADLLRQGFLKLEAAVGCDGVTWFDYTSSLEENIQALHQKLQRGNYKPKPARQVFIAKEDDSERGLSILCLEDKIVQQATVLLLNKIYETDFLGFSYGFRPGRGQHDVLDALHIAIMKMKVNWVLDLDVSKFSDTVEHGWLIKFIEHRIGDKSIIWLIKQ
jgi:retron-type reverse transcriptase